MAGFKNFSSYKVGDRIPDSQLQQWSAQAGQSAAFGPTGGGVGGTFAGPQYGAIPAGAPAMAGMGGAPIGVQSGYGSGGATFGSTSGPIGTDPAAGGTGFWGRVGGGLKTVGRFAVENPGLVIGGLALGEGYLQNRKANKLNDRALEYAADAYEGRAPLRDAGMQMMLNPTPRDTSFAVDQYNPYATQRAQAPGGIPGVPAGGGVPSAGRSRIRAVGSGAAGAAPLPVPPRVRPIGSGVNY